MAESPRRYAQHEIDELIACPKMVSEAPKRDMKLDRGHFRNDMRLKSTNGKLEFRVFMRRSEDLPENFSVGLAFLATGPAKWSCSAATGRTAATTTCSILTIRIGTITSTAPARR